MKKFKKLLALLCISALLLCSIPTGVLADGSSDVPEMTTVHTFVDGVSGLLHTRELSPGENTYNQSYFNLGRALDTSVAEYIEMDVYASNATDGVLHFWVSENRESSATRGRYTLPALNPGWNHIILAADNCTAIGSGYNFKTYNFVYPFLEGAPYSASSQGGTIKIANVAVSKSAPDMKNNYENVVWKNEGMFWTSLSATGNTAIANSGSETYFPRINSGAGVDASAAEYIEFDVWTDVAVKNTMYLWVSSNAWAESGRKAFIFPALSAGWNHICVNLSQNVNEASWAAPYDITSIKGFFLEGTPQTDENVPLNLKFANVAFTKSYPDIDGRLSHLDVVWQNPTAFWSIKVASGTYLPQGPANNFAYINGGNTVDASTAKYVELDIYASADLTSGGLLWLSRNDYGGSGRGRVSFGTLKKGWNHVCAELSTINTLGGEWEADKPYDASILKTAFLEITPNPVDESVTEVELKMANIAFTNDSENDSWAKLDGVYSNNMILQRNKPMYISGTGRNADIRVDMKNAEGAVIRTAATQAENGVWSLNLDPMEGGYDTYSLELYCNGNLQTEVKNIRIGEVFVASGQSNMDMKMWETYDGAQKYYNDSYDKPNISIYTLPDTYLSGDAVPYEPDKNHVTGSWVLGDTSGSHNVSAVAYHYADAMQQKLDMPVGVMVLALGGSSIFAWISRDAIEADDTLMNFLNKHNIYYDETNWTESNAQQKMSSLYNLKVYTAAGLQISGMIWYQGCNEVGIEKGIYTHALEVLRDCYAETFNYTDGKLPFVLTQLHAYGFTDPGLPNMWTQMAQAVAQNPDDMGQITIYDLPLDWDYSEWAPFGMGGDPIHPITKEPVGKRLAEAMYALKYDSSYGESSPPVWNGTKRIEGKYIYLDFDFVGDGLATPDGIALDGFSIADSKGIFVNAKAEIVDDNTVRVYSDTIDNPVDVSYCFDNYSITSNLYGTQNGGVFMPAVPFITTADTEITRAENNSWYAVDDATLTHIEGLKFGYYDSWTAEGASAQIVSDVKDYGDGSLKLEYTGENESFYASPTLLGKDGVKFSDINYNYSFYDRIDFKVKNTGGDINFKQLAILSNDVWYYAEINEVLSADSGWVNLSADLNSLKDEDGNVYNPNVLSSVSEIRFVFDGVTSAGTAYIDTIQLGNSTYGGFREVPEAPKTASVGEFGVSLSYMSVINTAYIGDNGLMSNASGVDASDSDFIEFDIYINDITEVERLKGLGYSFAMWISSNSQVRWNNRCNFDFTSQLTKSGWNHVTVRMSDISYRESGFTFENMYYFYITCNNSKNERTNTSLYVKLSNFTHTVHAGDLTADGKIDILDIIRMKKVQLGEETEYDVLALDTDRSGVYESAVDFVTLRKQLFESF